MFIVVGDCKSLEIRVITILWDINEDAEVLIVGVEVNVFGIDCVWLLVDWKIHIHLNMDVQKYLLFVYCVLVIGVFQN